MNAADIVGYSYQADTYTQKGIIERLIADGLASPAARDMRTEDALTQIAEASAIDRFDESTYDSGEFPKVIFADSVEDDEEGNPESGWNEHGEYVPLLDEYSPLD